jgi:hypothetical protein
MINVAYGIHKLPRIYNWPFLIRMHRKLLWTAPLTLSMEIVWILSKLFLVTLFRLTI